MVSDKDGSAYVCGYNCGNPTNCNSCTGWAFTSFCSDQSKCVTSCAGTWCGPGATTVSPAKGIDWTTKSTSGKPIPTTKPAPPPPSLPKACSSVKTPKTSKCTGCPPRKNGKLCASTTRYNDQTRGACGCGLKDPVPLSWWTKTKYTAAMNCKNLDPFNPSIAWCGAECGGCYRLCTTGGTTNGGITAAGVCRVFKIDNRCGDGFDGDQRHPPYPYWCSQNMSWRDCEMNPQECSKTGSTNFYGYTAHFDLQDLNFQISKGLGWDNPEVTFEPVTCSSWTGPTWDCFCKDGGAPVTASYGISS